MKVSIIIITGNNFLKLKRTFDSIEKYTDLSNKEIIVVSNGSIDETVSYIEEKKQKGFPCKILEFSNQISFSKAVNIGVLASIGEFLLLFQDDAVIREKTEKDLYVNWMLSPFYADLTVGMTGWFKFRDPQTKENFILFSCCMIKRNIFELVGGLEETSDLTYKEVGFCVKLKKNGFRVTQVPEDFPVDETTNTAKSYSPVAYGSGSNIEIFDDYVIKTSLDNKSFKRTYSNLDNEFYCIKKFSLNDKNIYCPEIQKIDKEAYKIKRYKFSLGYSNGIDQENVKRMFFTISFPEFVRQVEEIKSLLKQTKINHRDINPANLLFSEEDRHLKLIDFFWAKTDNLVIGDWPGLNPSFSTDDSLSFQKIELLVSKVFEDIEGSLQTLFSILSKMGRTYLDGSAPAPGVAYHRIDIPYFFNVPICKDTTKEFMDILTNISCKPKKVLDVGCAFGYNSFNLMRKFFLDKVFAFEPDPYVSVFLQECKRLFNLKELELNGSIDYTTFIPIVDVVICTNVHQWIYKQLGKEKTGIVMNNLISNCKEMFFQTSGTESGGKQVEDLRNKDDIRNYLLSVGAKEVTFINSSSAHGGLRHLFKVRGKNET